MAGDDPAEQAAARTRQFAESEKPLLGLFLRSTKMEVVKCAKPHNAAGDVFGCPAHETIFRIACDLWDSGKCDPTKPIPRADLIIDLSERGLLEAVGGADYVCRLYDCPASESLPRLRQKKTGRARRPGQKSLTIRLPKELALASRSAAVRAGVSWSDLVAKFIREGLRHDA